MLDALRQATRSWAVKVLLGVLVLSFAVWGVSGEFFGYRAGTLAEVGNVEVTTVEFDRTLRNRMQALSQQLGRGFSMEQARATGLTQQILGELIAEAALRDQARQYNLGVSDDRVAEVITSDPMFRGAGGRFDRLRFQTLLRNVGMTEESYVRDTRHQMLRQQLASAVAGGIEAPAPLVEALYKYQNETRRVAYLVVNESVIEPVGEPDEAALAAYFEENQARFRAPEYRAVGLVALDPETVADADAVSGEDVRQAYEAQLSEFTRPERRRVQQMRVADEAEANEIMAEIEAGGDFLAVAQARGLSRSDVDLGMRARPEIIDAAVAEAAFGAEPGEVVAVLDGRLGPAVARVTEVEEGSVRPFEEVEARLRAQIAERDARDRIFDLYDAIEDERAGGATLEEVARGLGLSYETVEVAQDGTDPAGEPVRVPGGEALIAEAFDSDVGLENDPLRAEEDTYVFYAVLEVVPERDRTLEEARADVVTAWQRDEAGRRIAELSQAVIERVRAGEPLAEIAEELGAEVRSAEGVTRGGQAAGLSRNAVAQAFAGPEGHVALAEGETAPARVVLRVEDVTVPAYFAESSDAQAIESMLGQALTNDILQAYTAHLMQTRRTTVNRAAYAQLTGQVER